MTNKNYIFAGAAALVLGLFMPVFSLPMVGAVNLFGNGGNLAGLIILAAAALAVGWTLKERPALALWPTAAAGGVLVYVFGRLQWAMAQMREQLRSLEDNPFAGLAESAIGTMQLQWGWLLLILGVGLMAYGAWRSRELGLSLFAFPDRASKVVAALSVLGVVAMPVSDAVSSAGRNSVSPSVQGDAALPSATATDATLASRPSREETAYIAGSLEIYELQARYYNTYGDGRVPGVTFKVKNTGNRTLNRVTVRVVFLDASGQPIAEEDYSPVLVSDYSFGDTNRPLRPNYIAQQERGMFWTAKSVPNEWEPGRVTATITEIEFAPPEAAPSGEGR